MACHHPDMFIDHRHCDSGDLMFLICHVTPRDVKGYWTLWVKAPRVKSHFVAIGLM